MDAFGAYFLDNWASVNAERCFYGNKAATFVVCAPLALEKNESEIHPRVCCLACYTVLFCDRNKKAPVGYVITSLNVVELFLDNFTLVA